jgi:tyrosyl-tRNA synthetase
MSTTTANKILSELDSTISFVESKVVEEEEEKKELNDKSMDINARICIAESIGEDIVGLEELRLIFLNKKRRAIAYDGFEPSGRMHIAQGILKAINVNKLTSIGCDFVFWIADWFALLNNKMGGDLAKIRVVGAYMIEVWRAAGMDMKHVYFRWCSDDINKNSNEYWLRVIDISKMFSITRTKRCCTILGRQESDDMPTANLLYACMQCADIFFLKADICQLGMDQLKVNMLAREYAKKKGIHPPVVISHHMLMGLKQGQEKMSKSMSDSAIFMEDTAADVKRKIRKAYAPPGCIENNPVLDYIKHLVFAKFAVFAVDRREENGGAKIYKSYNELEKDYQTLKLHPADLKPALAKSINEMIEPVRQHFRNNTNAKKLLSRVKQLKVTR